MSASKGFTIIEILIAMVVLSLGLLGILGVFPAGIKKTAEIVEDSNAAMIAESSRNAMELALQNARIDDGADKGFIYLGEGVDALMEERGNVPPVDITLLDGTPPSINKAADYWVKLPYNNGEEYLYPRFDPTIYAVGAFTADNLPPVKRVFPCGAQILKDVNDPGLTTDERKEAERDPYSQYSYAFIVREAKVGDPPAYTTMHSLYEVTIYIYKNFPSNLFDMGNDAAGFANSRHQPVKIFKTLISF